MKNKLPMIPQKGKPEMKITKSTGEPTKAPKKKELVLTFRDTGSGFESSVQGSGFSMFEQIGIIQSLLTDLIHRNFKSEAQQDEK